MAGTKTKKSEKAAALERHGITPEQALGLLREMLFYRRFEEKAEEAYAIGRIGGFCPIGGGSQRIGVVRSWGKHWPSRPRAIIEHGDRWLDGC